jgi:hypothetical protein
MIVIVPLRPGTRRVFERFAALACPPELVGQHLMPALLHEFELQVACLPAGVRRAVGPTLLIFNQTARLGAGGRGRSFVRLDRPTADAYLSKVLQRRRGVLSGAVRLVKSLVVLCYYELPTVKAQLGYHPEAYIAQVAARRLASYGAEIAAAESASLRDDAKRGPAQAR